MMQQTHEPQSTGVVNALPPLKRRIIGVPVSEVSFEGALDRIVWLAKQKMAAYVCIASVHMLIESRLSEAFCQILEAADMVTPDGRPVSLAMNLLYGTSQEQVAGPELMPALFKRAQSEGLSLFFYGNTDVVLEKIKARLTLEYPDVKVAGMLSPPFRVLSDEEKVGIVSCINDSGADIVLVALGCPKQERWMAEHRASINGVMLGVGAAFAFYAETIKRPPRWIQRYCLEWLYRLLKEPRRLLVRYLIGNSLFLFWLALDVMRQRVWRGAKAVGPSS